MAAVWLLLYGLNAYWLTAVHKLRRSLRKQLVLPKLSPAREYQTAQVTASPSSSSGAIAFNNFDNFDNFDQFRLDKSFASNFSNYVLAVDPSEHYAVATEALPVVTVQLPIFNERYVSRRLVDAVCKLDYPRERMQIPVLDDYIDDTQEIRSESVQENQNKGFWIKYVNR